MHRFREPVSGFTHLFGAIFALLGLAYLVAITRHDTATMLTMFIYGVSAVLVYMASALLHLSRGSKRKIRLYRKLDHASIYLVIAGTYTPFADHLLEGNARWAMLIMIWGLAIVGILYKLRYLSLHSRSYFSTILYLIMGWLGILVAPHWLSQLPSEAIVLMVVSGLILSGGAVIYALDKPNLHHHFNAHDLWHLFVLAGTGLQFFVVVQYLAKPMATLI